MKRKWQEFFTAKPFTGEGRVRMRHSGNLRRRGGRRFTPLIGELLERRALLTGTSSISGTVWNDLNGDGSRGGNEPTFGGITVYLDLNDNRVLDAAEPTKITAADGSYAFQDLDAGNYIVRHVPPVNYRITSPTVSGQRLFAVDTSTNPDRIVELNPTSGTELRNFTPPVANSSGDVGLAFDGQTLYFLSDSNDTLYELNATTGAVLDSTALASGFYGGLASLNGKVYALNWSSRVVSIFDPVTNAVTTGYDLDSVNSGFFMTHGLGNAAATGELVAATSDGSVAFVNATTGGKISSFAVDTSNSVGSIEAIGDDILVGYSFTNRLEVYSRTTHSFVRPLNLSFSPKETAGWGDTSGAQRVTLAAGQAATNTDFGDQFTLVSIAGTRWQDTNGNGVHDAGEPPLPGKIVYLDLNDNSQRDSGEPTAFTANDGSYLFSGLAIGKYVVREEVTSTYQQTFPAIERKRLFVTDVFQDKIVELDPQSGAVLKTLPTPISSQIFNGLAFDGKTIYFLSNDNDILYWIDPDSGTILGQTTLPSGSYQELAYLNGLVYIRVMNSAFIKAFDPVTKTIVNTITVTGIPSAYIYYGLGEMTGPDRILSRDLQSEVFTIDPANGATSILFTLGTSNPYALTSVGQEIFAGYSGGSNGQIDVYSRSGSLLRSFNNATTPAAFALAGMQWTETALRVTLGYGQNATGLDFGTTEELGTPSTTISLAGSNITIADTSVTAQDDQWRLERSGTNVKLTNFAGGSIDASAVAGASGSGTSVVTFPLSLMEPAGSLIVDSRGGNDTLTIDLSGGDLIPAGGITYSGGNPTTGPGDKLTITGGSQGTVTYNYTNAHDGSIVMSNFGTVNYTGLEPIINSGSATDVIFNLPAGPNTVTLGDDGTIGNALSRLSAATIETTDFANPTGSLTINRGNSGDALTVNNLPDFNAGLTVGSAALGMGSITFGGGLALAANKNLAAYAVGKISFPNITSNIATSGTGSIGLTTSRNIVVSTGAALSTVDGGISLAANQQAGATSGNFSGISISGSVTTTGTGNIVLKGAGGTDATTSLHMGVDVLSGVVRSTAARADAGRISIVGVGGVGTADNDGVAVEGAGANVESVSGDIQITGTGGNGSTTLNRGVAVINGGQIKSTGTGATAADIDISGTGGTGTSTNYGVVFGASSLATTVNGNFTVVGQGGNSVSGGQALGVLVTSGGVVQGGVTGLLSITGTGGASSGSVKSGVRVINAGSLVTSAGADVKVVGFGGAGGSFNRGVELFSGGQILAGGTGTVTVSGTGGAATGDENQGVLVNGATTSIASTTGDLVVTGAGGGTGASISNGGVVAVSGGVIRARGVGNLQITGTGGNPDTSSNGVALLDVTTDQGDITITGIPVSDAAPGANLAGVVTPGAGGKVTVVTDRLSFPTGGKINAAAQAVVVVPRTAGIAIDLGGQDSTTSLGLSDAELDLITAGTLQIGNTTSGPITVSAPISRLAATNMSLTSGGAINIAAGSVDSAGGLLRLSPGSSATVTASNVGNDAVLGSATLSFATGTALAFAINGTTVDTQYEQLNVVGSIDLTGVDLTLTGSYLPVVGNKFVLVNNDGTDGVVGEFTGLPDNQVFAVANGALSGNYQITYHGGDGNDVVLLAINVPPSFDHIVGDYATPDENPVTHGPAAEFVVVGWATNIKVGPANEAGQSWGFETNNDGTGLFTAGGQPRVDVDGTLRFTPRPNARGIAHITVVLHDDGGGTNSSDAVTFQIEITKPRRLHNSAEPGKRNGLDVTGSSSDQPDGSIAANDALAVINYINAHESGPVRDEVGQGPPYCDVTGDNNVAADDVLAVINFINAGNPAEGEASGTVDSASSARSASDLFSILAVDLVDAQMRRRRVGAGG